MIEDHTPADPLSPAGLARRAEMRARLEHEVAARGRRRRLARSALLTLPVIALLLGAARYLLPSDPVARHGPIAADPSSGPPEAGSTVAAERAGSTDDPTAPGEPDIASWQTIPRAGGRSLSYVREATPDPTLLARSRYRSLPQVPAASDDDLVAALRASGQAAGLVRTPESAWIVPDGPSPAS